MTWNEMAEWSVWPRDTVCSGREKTEPRTLLSPGETLFKNTPSLITPCVKTGRTNSVCSNFTSVSFLLVTVWVGGPGQLTLLLLVGPSPYFLLNSTFAIWHAQYFIFYYICLPSTLEYKLHEDRHFYLFYLLLYLQHSAWHFAGTQSYWLNVWMNFHSSWGNVFLHGSSFLFFGIYT